LTTGGGTATIRAEMPPFIDAHVHANNRSSEDFRRLAAAGCAGVVAVAGEEGGFSLPESVLDHFRRLARVDRPRLQAAGVKCWLALGVHPRGIPASNAETLWPRLPEIWRELAADAVGEVGLEDDSPAERRALLEQLRLADQEKLPVIVHTPRRHKAMRLRTTLEILADSGIAPERVCLDHLDEDTLEPAADSGCWLGLTVHPAKLSPARVAGLVASRGGARIIVSSDLGANPSYLFGVPAAEQAMREMGLDEQDIRAAVHDNAAGFMDRPT